MAKLGIVGFFLLGLLTVPAFAHDEERFGTARDVRQAQRTLDDLGYPVGTVDGRIGARTRTAIRNFQRDKGLNATGRLDADTREALENGSRPGERARDERAERPARAGNEDRDRSDRSRVRRAQATLDRLGYPVSHVDGEYGAETRTAIRNFQRDNGLNATGELDPETMSALEAGRGATSSRTR